MARLNYKWASGIGADGNPVYAPANVIEVNGRKVYNPKDKHYAAAGIYMEVKPDPPADPAPEGWHYEPRGWEIVTAKGAYTSFVERQYVLVADPPAPPRRWTRLALKTALAQAEMLDAAKAYLQAEEIATGYTAWEALTDADYIEEGYPTAERWNAILDGAAVALGKTRALIDAFLDTVPTEGGV